MKNLFVNRYSLYNKIKLLDNNNKLNISSIFKFSKTSFCSEVGSSSNQNGIFTNQNLTLDSTNESQNSKKKKTGLFLWNSSVAPTVRKNDLKSRYLLTNEPRRVEFFNDKVLKYVYCGIRHYGALTEEGNLYMWGKNPYGALGVGNNDERLYNEPKLVEYFTNMDIKIKKFCCSDFNTIALSEDGDVYTWGYGGRSAKFFPLIRDFGCIGEVVTDSRFTPGGLTYFVVNGIVIRDISAGAKHMAALDYEGNVYIWGKGHYGIMGTGSNFNSLTPVKNRFLENLRKKNPKERVIKIDCADDYTAALTSNGNIYAWGINNQGQLGTGGGTGKDYTDTEKFPTLVAKSNPGIKYVDFTCGENTMLIKDELGNLYRTGLKIDYVPGIIELSKTVKPKSFYCGRSFYCMIDEHNNVYQWGNLFKRSKTDKNDNDMYMIKSKDLFGDKKIITISSKFTLSAAIVED